MFFTVFGTSGIWGNLISYFILNQNNSPQVNNCGVYFNPLAKTETDSAPDVSNLTVIPTDGFDFFGYYHLFPFGY